jgi:AcrR family transcriptional regulator
MKRRAEFVEAAIAAVARHGPDTSTEQIAAQAGVARTRLYRHFTDAADLQRSIARRAGELISDELKPVWDPRGSPADTISTGVRTHLRWLTEHRSLYRYLLRHSVAVGPGTSDAISDIKATIGAHLTRLFDTYLTAFGLDSRVAEPLGFGIVGLVESATSRWLEDPSRLTREELGDHLSDWIWRILDDTLRAGGIVLDPLEPLAPPDSISAGSVFVPASPPASAKQTVTQNRD